MINFLNDENGLKLPFDVFDKKSLNNNNGVIFGDCGTGKSYFASKMANREYLLGTKTRIIDIGGTHKRFCQNVGGKFVNLSINSVICLNPFPLIMAYDDITSILSVVAQMIVSKTKQNLGEIELEIIKMAIHNVYNKYADEGDITKVYETLLNPECFMSGFQNVYLNDIIDVSKMLAFNIKPFTDHGEYGRWFNGSVNYDAISDDFIVFEMEELIKHPNLFPVVALQLFNFITTSLCFADKSQKKLIIIDEAWQFPGHPPMVGQVIEDGIRKSRANNAGVFLIFQSTKDIDRFDQYEHSILDLFAHKLYFNFADIKDSSKKGVFSNIILNTPSYKGNAYFPNIL